jgi:hypothetical protein
LIVICRDLAVWMVWGYGLLPGLHCPGLVDGVWLTIYWVGSVRLTHKKTGIVGAGWVEQIWEDINSNGYSFEDIFCEESV